MNDLKIITLTHVLFGFPLNRWPLIFLECLNEELNDTQKLNFLLCIAIKIEVDIYVAGTPRQWICTNLSKRDKPGTSLVFPFREHFTRV